MGLDFTKFPNAIAIVGSREFPNLGQVDKFVNKLNPGTLIISGGAIGVDKRAEKVARRRGLPEPLICLPKQEVIDKSGYVPALFARNTDIVMATKEREGIVVAFLLDPSRTGGTDDTLKKCNKYDVPSITFRMTEEGIWLTTLFNQTFQNHPQFQSLLLT